jgi:hypothetical protein
MSYASGQARVVLGESTGTGGTLMIDLLGLVIFATIIGIGLLDLQSGLGPFSVYRSAVVPGVRRKTPTTGPRGDDNQPTPPTPAQ